MVDGAEEWWEGRIGCEVSDNQVLDLMMRLGCC